MELLSNYPQRMWHEIKVSNEVHTTLQVFLRQSKYTTLQVFLRWLWDTTLQVFLRWLWDTTLQVFTDEENNVFVT